MTAPHHLDRGWWQGLTLHEFLPDETLYSWASRYHRRSGNALARNTSLQLFGQPRGGTEHDLTCGLDTLTTRTQGLLGSAEELVHQRTLLPFYLPTQTPAAQAAAISVLRGERLGSLKYRLGLLTSRFGAHHPLKACVHCLRDQSAGYGEAYWQRSQQWPGVWLCERHGTWLYEARVKVHGIRRFQWELPESALLTPVSTDPPPPVLFDLAAIVRGWLVIPRGFAFEPRRLAATYRVALAERGWTRGSKLQLAALNADYAQWSCELRKVPELAPLAGDGCEASLARILRQSRSGVHPLRHIAVIAWLFPDWQAFFSAYCAVDLEVLTAAEVARGPEQTANQQAGRRSALVSLLRDGGVSLRQAALQVGVAVSTAQHWATQAGVAVGHRPKQLKQQLRKEIVAHLRCGKRQQDIAIACGVHVAMVRAVLRSEIGLHEQWRLAVAQRRLTEARRHWTALRKRQPSASLKELRATSPATFAWLYRNDREWLTTHAPPLEKRHHDRQLRLDWDARDATLSRALAHAAAGLQQENDRSPIALWRLCQSVPDLRPKLRYLDRLPRTDALLHRLRARRPTPEFRNR